MSQLEGKTKKKVIIIISILLAIVAVFGIAIVFFMNYNTFSPDKPIILDDGENIYVSTSLNDNYIGYRFKFNNENKEITIDSSDNILSIDTLLENNIVVGNSYKISVCYLANNEGNNSEYSEVTEWKCKIYLTMPQLYFNFANNMLTWNEVENADYYRIYYSNVNELGYLQTEDCFYDMQDLPGKKMSISVVAFSNNQNYKTSLKSHSIEINLVHKLAGFSQVSFDEESKILTATSTENYQKIEVYLEGVKFETNRFVVEFDETENQYNYSIDLTTIYNGEETIGIAPTNIDNYNVYVGEIAIADKNNI